MLHMDLMQSTIFWLSFSFTLGFGLILFLALLFYFLRKSQAKAEAQELIEEAQERAKDLEDTIKLRIEAHKEQEWENAEPFIKKIEENVEKLESLIAERTEDLEEAYKEKEANYNRSLARADQMENQVNNYDKKVQSRRDAERQTIDQFIEKLSERAEAPLEQVRGELEQKIISERQVEMSKYIQYEEEIHHENAEISAKKLLNLAINRFARPYCPERGISYLYFETPEQKENVLGPEQSHLRLVEKLCGVDLAYDENYNAISVYGFDPVRRALGHATVERMFKEKGLNPNRIENILEKIKKDMFQRIVQDGEKIAKELRIDGLHKEVKNMMGALRHRYSFTQNQYFHCAEVGFLAGVMGAELDVPVKDARRAGLLHDIGKAMDHSIDGGHAVIGADFIKKHGEADHIVHAVRAHHFDETPETDLAYLVIAADALSGARPGARRSTATSYTQKIQDLQSIAGQFDGVTDTHILSAGREVRVYVDGRRVDDLKALNLTREIAEKIESEMSFPGQIKVTVVRQTQAVEYAK